jgi:hypothetical protein
MDDYVMSKSLLLFLAPYSVPVILIIIVKRTALHLPKTHRNPQFVVTRGMMLMNAVLTSTAQGENQ